ncbi:MAG TPA: nuclear transport factor 2 family protein [Kofleriaceae bacterium]|nr:nuclear transport factor 2 family protein [Kofleriaceae bacterium]
MTNIERFLAYAAAFEQTYADDDWRRLEQYFTEDATYRVSGLPTAYELKGRDNILRGIRKSVDGFDRKMTVRTIVPTAPPTENDGKVTFRGFVRYQREGSPPVELHATLVAELDGDRICSMHDTFNIDAAGQQWLERYARDLDGSYV